MTPYQRGARLEYLARDVLRQRGYSAVTAWYAARARMARSIWSP